MNNIQELEAACAALESSTNKEIATLAGVVRELVTLIVRQVQAAAALDPIPSTETPSSEAL